MNRMPKIEDYGHSLFNSPFPYPIPRLDRFPFDSREVGSSKYLFAALQQILFSLQTDFQIELSKNQILLGLYNAARVKIEEQPRSDMQMEMPVQILKEEQQKIGKDKKMPINDTKNIPKNFGKAIIAFINKNPKITKRCLSRYQIQQEKFLHELKQRKKNLHSIKELRALWLEDQFVYAKPFRELSHYFLNRGSFRYIFSSRVVDYGGHLKYRSRILEALTSPTDFNSIKK